MPDAGAALDAHARLAAVLAEVGSVGKDATNKAQGWSYRSIEAMLAALHPAMARHGVLLAPDVESHSYEPAERGGWIATVVVRYDAICPGDRAPLGRVVGTGHDPGDKAMTKALTYAFKSFLGQLFAMADVEDPDAESPDASGRARSQTGDKSGRGASTRSGDRDINPSGNEASLSKDQAIARKATELGLSDDVRQDVIAGVTGGRTTSGKDVTAREVPLVFAALEARARAGV